MWILGLFRDLGYAFGAEVWNDLDEGGRPGRVKSYEYVKEDPMFEGIALDDEEAVRPIVEAAAIAQAEAEDAAS